MEEVFNFNWTTTGCRLVLRDVRHVPDIRLSLISAGLLDDEGYANNFCDGRWKLSRGCLIMARLEMMPPVICGIRGLAT
ncbi:unnamed protein product [Cuscuta campestris]|uniref:Uncharacterized protein n=1 Tax=Cuscuta campestris TaxID=132261 RepID=A0A484KEL5_9ASTE|nr:unnamed protein product [Cuscuta campestris]